jgi:hypothetical protein
MEYFKKLNAIRDLLKAEFENSEVSVIYESDSFAQTFVISEENKIYLVKIRRSFIDDHKVNDIPNVLKEANIRNYFNDKDIKRVTIDTSGITTE